MASIYSTRFIRALGATTGTYTVPAGKTAIVRSVQFVNGGGAAAQFTILSGNPANVYAFNGYVPPLASPNNNNNLFLDLRLVLTAGDILNVGIPASCYATVSGYLFTL